MNICASHLVEAPHLKSVLQANGEQGIRIPVSVGERTEESDKSGEPCEAYDVIVADSVLKQTESDVEYKQLVCQLAIAAVGQKYKLDLDDRFTLPRIKYKGSTVKSQRIRIKRDSQIEEVLADSKNADLSKENVIDFSIEYISNSDSSDRLDGFLLPIYKSITDEVAENLQTKMFGSTPSNSNDLQDRHVEISIPLKIRPREAEISDEAVFLDLPGSPDFRIWFPIHFDSNRSSAEWDGRRLLIRVASLS